MTETPEVRVSGLAGRVAVVTGAGRGIGRAVAVALHAQGARVAALDRDVPSAAPPDGADGSTWLYVQCDVGDERAVDDAFSTVETELGRVSVLVNNAGILH